MEEVTRDTATMRWRSQSRSSTWAAYAASVWAFVFAAMSFYWAAGGTVADYSIGPAIIDRARSGDTAFLAVIWLTGVLKVVGGLVALALVRSFGRSVPRRLLLALAGGGGALTILYGGASWIQHGLMMAGVLDIPEGLGRTAARWHFFFWDPFWVVGGILFVLAAWHYRRATQLDAS